MQHAFLNTCKNCYIGHDKVHEHFEMLVVKSVSHDQQIAGQKMYIVKIPHKAMQYACGTLAAAAAAAPRPTSLHSVRCPEVIQALVPNPDSFPWTMSAKEVA